MDGNLETTNVILLIMAIVSVLEALLLVGMGVGGFLIYRRVMQLVNDLEARQVAPLREKVDAILSDVKTVTARVSTQTERVDQAITGTIDRVDDTAERMKSTVREKVNQTVGVARGIRAVVMSLLMSESRPKPPAPAAGTA
jgi:ElaB/YqjD/DUF883 family membrane-anchored ribosome-binding protein